MKIKLWGTRGSIPAPFVPSSFAKRISDVLVGFFEKGHTQRAEVESYLNSLPTEQLSGFGGNTSCCEIKTQTAQMIIDGGTGIRLLGYDMMKGPAAQGKGDIHIFMTHFHWDHLMGLPFFTPLFIPGNKVHFYAVQPELESMIRGVFRKPYFPVPFEGLGATISFHRLESRKPVQFGDLKITPYQLDHPDPCWGYRVEHNGKSVAYCVDTECLRTTPEELGADLALYQNVDLMIFDSQYTLSEAIEKVDWGHAAATIGLDLAFREKIKKVVFTHHDPAASDAKIAAARDQALKYHQSQKKIAQRAGQEFFDVEWLYGIEGQTFEL